MNNNEYKNCPYCDEEIKAIAVKCRYCKSLLYIEETKAPDDYPQKQTNNEAKDKIIKEKQSVEKPLPRKNKVYIWIAILLGFLVLSSVVGYFASNGLPDDLFVSKSSSNQLYLGESSSSKPAPKALTYTEYAIVDVDVLRLRGGPSTDHPILDRLNYGTSLTIVSKDKEWIKVITPTGKEGWVHGDYVTNYILYDPVYASGDYYDVNEPILINLWTPDDKFWSAFGYEAYWRLGTTYMDFGMVFNEILTRMGEPETIEENIVVGDSISGGYEIIMIYPFMDITCYYETGTGYDINRNNARILSIYVHDPIVFGPRNIRVDDTFESILEKVPNDNNSIKEIDDKYEVNDKTVYYQQILYGSEDEQAPFAEILYDVNKEPLAVDFYDIPFGGFGNGVLYINITKKKVDSYIVSWQSM